ncbi:MAG: fibronectin type III domain-containing protein, partial [Actinomycetota bacterium]|nr:fibronectin type III domain-containing protein [Actinomycetota bacterium]
MKPRKISNGRKRSGIIASLVIFLSSILGFGALPLFITGQIPASASVAPSNAVTRFANSNATLYVSTVGKDTNNTTCSQTQPCLTIANAISVANKGDTIDVAAGIYNTDSSGTIEISKDVTIQGSGASSTFVGGTSSTDTVNGSVFSINSPSIKATISGITIRFGKTAQGTTGGGPIGGGSSGGNGGAGGGIYNAGNLTITNDTITDNSTGTGGSAIGNIAPGGNGGSGAGIYNAGTLIANSDIISNNTTGIGASGNFISGYGGDGGVGGNGGGIYNAINATANLSNDTITYNGAGNGGDGGGANTTAINSGSGGFGGSGGGIYNAGTLTTTNDTISNNTNGNMGAGLCGLNCVNTGGNGSGAGIYNDGDGKLTAIEDTVSNNKSRNLGGGVYNSGVLTASNVTLTGNSSYAGNGGGIYNAGNTGVTGSSVTGNLDGGISNTGILSATNDTITNNQSNYYDGGIYNIAGSLIATNDTISNNSSFFSGGGIDNMGYLIATNDTITNNTATKGDGIFNGNSANLIFAATIIADQKSTGDCNNSGNITDAGYNLDSDGSCGLSKSNNSFPNTTITLPTTLTQIGNSQVIEVVPPSPAYDVIPVSSQLCTGGTDLTIGGVTGINIPSTDQVGDPRVVPGASYCSIGAYQYRLSGPTITGSTPSTNQITLDITPPTNNGGASIDSYGIYYSTTQGSELSTTPIPCKSTNTTPQSCTVTNLNPATTYYFEVEAHNTNGYSSPSKELIATTQALIVPSTPSTITPPTSTPPTTPTTPNPPTTPSSPSQVPNEGYLLAASDGGV